MNEILANVSVIAATAGTVVFLLPQIAKLIRTRDPAGVSTTWAALGLVTNVAWLTYMVNARLVAAIAAPVFMVLSYTVTLWALARAGRHPGRSLVIGAMATGLYAVTALIAGWETLGVVLGLSYGVMVTPAVWAAYRTRNPSGISAGTWWIGLVEGVLWGYYGLFQADAGIITFSAVALVASTLILPRYYGTRRLASATA